MHISMVDIYILRNVFKRMKSIVNKIVLLKVANDKFADFLQSTFLTQ